MAKRFPNDDAVVFFTNDPKDILVMSGHAPITREIATAVMDFADLRGVVKHMIGYEEWIARKTVEWHTRYLSI